MKHDIIIQQGATFKLHVDYTDDSGNAINLTSYTGRGMYKAAYSDVEPLAEFTVTLGGAAGTVDIELSAADTADLEAGEGVYDIELESNGGEVIRLLEGAAYVTAEVTKAVPT